MSEPDHRLDITSDPALPSDGSSTSPGNGAAGQPAKSKSKARKTVRIWFGCCSVYARIPVPDRVMKSQTSTWRVHCVKCGQLVEIPV